MADSCWWSQTSRVFTSTTRRLLNYCTITPRLIRVLCLRSRRPSLWVHALVNFRMHNNLSLWVQQISSWFMLWNLMGWVLWSPRVSISNLEWNKLLAWTAYLIRIRCSFVIRRVLLTCSRRWIRRNLTSWSLLMWILMYIWCMCLIENADHVLCDIVVGEQQFLMLWRHDWPIIFDRIERFQYICNSFGSR